MTDYSPFPDDEPEDEELEGESTPLIPFSDLDIEVRENLISTAAGILDIDDLIISVDQVDTSALRTNRFESFGDGVRFMESSGVLHFTHFFYIAEEDTWGMEVLIDSP